jgi:hypothetical protein
MYRYEAAPPHLDVDERCLPPLLCLALEIGLVLAPKHAIGVDHPLPFGLALRSAIEPRRRVPSGSSGTSLDLRGSYPRVPGDFSLGGFVVRLGT